MHKLDGIEKCMLCVGMHPGEIITKITQANRMFNPQEYVKDKLMSLAETKDGRERRVKLYKNKMCVLCGQAYNNTGHPDETWDLTARQIKIEFDSAGIPGVSDKNVELVVADCRKSWVRLWAHRHLFTPQQQERLTFAGRLAVIITSAQETREKGGKVLWTPKNN